MSMDFIPLFERPKRLNYALSYIPNPRPFIPTLLLDKTMARSLREIKLTHEDALGNLNELALLYLMLKFGDSLLKLEHLGHIFNNDQNPREFFWHTLKREIFLIRVSGLSLWGQIKNVGLHNGLTFYNGFVWPICSFFDEMWENIIEYLAKYLFGRTSRNLLHGFVPEGDTDIPIEDYQPVLNAMDNVLVELLE